MVLIYSHRGRNNKARPLHPAQNRSLLVPITTTLLLIASTIPHLEAYSSIYTRIGQQPKDYSLLSNLVALSSLSSFSASAFAFSSGGNSFGGTSVPYSNRSGTGTKSPNKFSTNPILAQKSKSEAQANHNNNLDSYKGGPPKLPIADNTTAPIPPSSASPSSTSIVSNGYPLITNTMRQWKKSIDFSPRAKACILMATAMSLHFGGYEFARSAALAMFTSSETGFTHPSAYPFAIGLVTPTTLSLLYWYGILLKSKGPRMALRTTTSLVLAVLLVGDGLVAVMSPSSFGWLRKAIVGLLFVFQNSYAHLIYTQQWSFLGSVMTPSEGTRFFTLIAGLSSLVCTLTASSVQSIAVKSYGLVLLIFMTCATLGLSMLCADEAYQLSAKHGFDPSRELQEKQSEKDSKKQQQPNNAAAAAATSKEEEESMLAKTGRMFRTSPTLTGLFGEVIAFQSLSTVLNVCFVRQLNIAIPADGDRASFTGQFYAGVNGFSSLMQFFILPLMRKYLEPQWVYRFLPLVLMPLLSYAAFVPVSASNGLWIAAVTFFALKSTDYSIRGVATELVYQPLDFDARYLGKEVIGVFANRFGKSGTSMILSGLAGLGLMAKGTRPMSQLAVGVGGLWSACSFYLSNHVATNKEAEETVQQRSGGNRSQRPLATRSVAASPEAKPVSATTPNANQAKPVSPTKATTPNAKPISGTASRETIEKPIPGTAPHEAKAKPMSATVPRKAEAKPAANKTQTSYGERNPTTTRIKED